MVMLETFAPHKEATSAVGGSSAGCELKSSPIKFEAVHMVSGRFALSAFCVYTSGTEYLEYEASLYHIQPSNYIRRSSNYSWQTGILDSPPFSRAAGYEKSDAISICLPQ